MPTKAELYAQMAEKVATQLTGSWQEWAGFLTTCLLYTSSRYLTGDMADSLPVLVNLVANAMPFRKGIADVYKRQLWNSTMPKQEDYATITIWLVIITRWTTSAILWSTVA